MRLDNKKDSLLIKKEMKSYVRIMTYTRMYLTLIHSTCKFETMQIFISRRKDTVLCSNILLYVQISTGMGYWYTEKYKFTEKCKLTPQILCWSKEARRKDSAWFYSYEVQEQVS